MPLFRTSGLSPTGKHGAKAGTKTKNWVRTPRQTHEDGTVLSLTQLSLLSLADNMESVWVVDYAENYLFKYHFRYIMGPFNILSGELLEELICLLSSRNQLSPAALHLLLVPQLRSLSLENCPGLCSASIANLIATRCQSLCNLDLSGSRDVPALAQRDMLCRLPCLRSLSLAGTNCDGRVISVLARCCRGLLHLDVSRCGQLTPAALLPLGGDSTSCSSPLPLRSLLAVDVGFAQAEEDQAAAVAYLLLALPCLERVAVESLAQAFSLLHRRERGQAYAFPGRDGAVSLEDAYRARLRESGGLEKGAVDDDDDDDDDDDGGEEEEDGVEGLCKSDNEERPGDAREKPWLRKSGRVRGLTLRLRDVRCLSPASLGAAGRMCPDVCCVSLDATDVHATGGSVSSLVASGLQAWLGQLSALSVCHHGPLVELLPALRAVGSTLVLLTLEGVRIGLDSTLLELMLACPRLRELLVRAETADAAETQEVEEEEEEEEEGEEEEEEEERGDLPCLPDLRSLTLEFSYKHSCMRPLMYWMDLKRIIRCLLYGSLLLESVSLVALPCPLNPVFQDILRSIHNQHRGSDSSDVHPMALEKVKYLSLARTDVIKETVKGILDGCKRLKHLDLSYCWNINLQDSKGFQSYTNVTIVWI